MWVRLCGEYCEGVDMKLNGCVSKDGEEIDGREFTISTLDELIFILWCNKEVHLNYFDDEDDLDMWLKVSE